MLSEDLKQALNEEPGLACVLDAHGVIVFLHRDWDAVLPPGTPDSARADELLGKRWLDSITGAAAPYYERLLAEVFAQQRRIGAGLVHLSECNTSELVRQCTARFVPVFHEGGHPIAVTVVYGLETLAAATQRYGMSRRPIEAFTGDHGLVVQCSCCRRLKDPVGPAWEFVAEAVASSPPKVSHGLCPTCVALYYSDF